ncbi:MAG: ATP-binding protein, partial [Zoogloea sp.]|nr:ATP-binding protein [Zoogloea sp.]
NLINNAADASPEAIECEARIDDDALVVRVLDRGAGLPEGFDASSGHAAASASGKGLGIGLLLAFGAVERCGGRIAFSSRAGGGTIATLTLPLDALRP